MPRHDFTGDANWGVKNSLAAGTYDDSVNRAFGGAGPGGPLGPFVYPTFIIANVSGEVRQMPAALLGTNIVRQAWSTNDPAFWGSMGFTSNGGTWWPIGPSATLRVVAPITPFRNQAGGQPAGDAFHCGWAGYALCWAWVGSAHFDFTRIHVDLTLTQSPDTAMWQGSAATFTAGMSQTNFPGNPYSVDMSELQWRWISDSAATDSTACHSFSGPTCTHVFATSGTMYAAAYVNGEAQQKTKHVTVKVPELTLTATPGLVLVPGDSVTAVATGNGPVVVQGWSFTADSGGPPPTVGAGGSWGACVPGVSTCRGFVPQAGTISVIGTVHGVQLTANAHVDVVPPKITLIASRTTLPAGDSTTFTAMANGNPLVVQGWAFRADSTAGAGATAGGSWGTCAPNVAICTMVVPTSGYAFVTGTVAGYASSDSEHVTVTVPRLTVTATPSSVVTGTPVVFDAAAESQDAVVAMSGWQFRPDSGPPPAASGCGMPSAESSCVEIMVQSGRMWAYAQVNGRPDSASAAVTVTAPDSSGGGCGPSPSRTAAAAGRLRPAARFSLSGDCTGGAPVLKVDCPDVVRGGLAHCIARMTDSSSFTITRLRSMRDTTTLVDTTVQITGTSYDWSGIVAASVTKIFVEGTAGGTPVTATTLLRATARVFPDSVQSPNPTPMPGDGEPVMMAPYPGMVQVIEGSDTTWATLEGGVGRTWPLQPRYELQAILSGPNKGVVFVEKLNWIGIPLDFGATVDTIPAGIYITKAVFPGDAFYERQNGQGSSCGRTQMVQFQGEIMQHELLHYSRGIQIHVTFARTFEPLIRAKGTSSDGTILPNTKALFDKGVAFYFGQPISDSDTAIDAPGSPTKFRSNLTCQMRFQQ